MIIREQDPLKQGLKPTAFSTHLDMTDYSRARSTKTRIETSELQKQHLLFQDSRARSTKTRIETQTILSLRLQDIIREQDPLKQGLKLNEIQ